MSNNTYRPDQDGTHRLAFERNKKKILASQDICGICGKPVDKTLKWPHPLSPVIDHIVPIDKGGHPSDLQNLQLAHACCNRQKSDRIFKGSAQVGAGGQTVVPVSPRSLPQSRDWAAYRPQKQQGGDG